MRLSGLVSRIGGSTRQFKELDPSFQNECYRWAYGSLENGDFPHMIGYTPSEHAPGGHECDVRGA